MFDIRIGKTGRLDRVLVVEDCDATRQLIADSLELHGYAVATAADGEEGLARFRRGGFAVVLTDHDMPGFDGRQLAAAVKALSPETQVLMVSANPLCDDGGIPSDVDLFVRKPFTLVQLRAAVAAALQLSALLTPAR